VAVADCAVRKGACLGLDHYIVQVLSGSVSPGARAGRRDTEDGAFADFEDIAIHNELSAALYENIQLLILAMRMQKGRAVSRRNDAKGDFHSG